MDDSPHPVDPKPLPTSHFPPAPMSLLQTLTSTLDNELRLSEFTDASHNGLQVANSGKVTRICCGVDASLEFLHAAHAQDADFCFVHHGISWGDALARITGPAYDAVAFLIQHDIALYAAHLPLDAHPVLGNNAQIADALGLVNRSNFCLYHGTAIGVQGTLRNPLSFETLCNHVRTLTPGGAFHALPFGEKNVQTVGIVSGGAADEVVQAIDADLDVYITGEMNLQAYNAAKAGNIHVIAAGHYATERFGVKAIGKLLNHNFKIPWCFVDFDLPW